MDTTTDHFTPLALHMRGNYNAKKGMHKIKMLLNFNREKKKDLIQLSNNECYEYKIKDSKKVNYHRTLNMLVI